MFGAAERAIALPMGDDSFRNGLADSGKRFEFLRRRNVDVDCVDSDRIRSGKLKLDPILGRFRARSSEHGEDNYQNDG